MLCKQKLKTNELPMLTWNKFAVNYKEIPAPNGEFRPCFPKISAVSPAIRIDSKKCLDDAFSNFLPHDEAVAALTEESSLKRSVKIEKNAILTEPIIFDFSFINQNEQSEVFDICMGVNSSATIIFIFDTLSPTFRGSHMALIRVKAMEGAKLKLKTLNLLSNEFFHYEAILAKLDKNASVQLNQMALGGKSVVNGAYFMLDGSAAQANLCTDYIGYSGQELDFNYISKHIGDKSRSETKLNGILLKNSQKTARATIDFVRGCKGAIGNETENVLLLDEQVVNKSVPLILCGEDAVVGNHGTTIGSIDEDTLFYLQSRGLDACTANRIFLQSTIEKCKNAVPAEFAARIDKHCEALPL